MLSNVIHARAVSTQRTQPLLRFDGVLFLISPEELRDGDKAIVAELKTVLSNFPSVDVSEVRWDDWEAMIDEPAVDEVDIEPCAEVCKPDIAIQQTFGDVDEKSAFSSDEVFVLGGVVED